MAESDIVMKEVEKVTNDYVPLAEACSKIFFALVAMKGIHYLYEFSLSFFMDTFIELLKKGEALKRITKGDLE